MNNTVLEVGANPLGGEGTGSLVEADVQATFDLLVAELEAVPAAAVEALEAVPGDKIWGGNDQNFRSDRS
jgi:hypothetical protein